MEKAFEYLYIKARSLPLTVCDVVGSTRESISSITGLVHWLLAFTGDGALVLVIEVAGSTGTSQLTGVPSGTTMVYRSC